MVEVNVKVTLNFAIIQAVNETVKELCNFQMVINLRAVIKTI